MSLFDPYIPLLVYLAVWVVIYALAVLLKADKHGIIAKPYYLMLKTVVFNSWIEKIGSRFRRAWLTFFDIGAAMGIGLVVFVIYNFISNAIALFQHSSQAGPALLIVPLPGLTIGWDIFPYILLAIAVLLIPHELAHGIASVLDKVPLKSSGVFMAIFLPGGFVEIDEEDLAKRKARTKLRVFAAGSFTNVATWFVVFLLFVNFTAVISPFYQPTSSGVLVTSLVDGGAAQNAGIQPWSVITSINNTVVHQPIDLRVLLAPQTPGHHLLVSLNTGKNYTLVTRPAPENASRATIGIFSFNYFAPRSIFPASWTFYSFNALYWMSLILLGVALVNMLPLVPFDGDRYLDTLLGILGVKNTKSIRTVASVISLGLLGSNIILSYILFGTIFPR
jgi:membrane-associated protease RseP (regulator of RpoE activity)